MMDASYGIYIKIALVSFSILCLFSGFWLFRLYGSYYTTPNDTTDKEGHSNLRVYYDAATGVQYVQSSPFSTLVPRLNADGTLHTDYPYKDD